MYRTLNYVWPHATVWCNSLKFNIVIFTFNYIINRIKTLKKTFVAKKYVFLIFLKKTRSEFFWYTRSGNRVLDHSFSVNSFLSSNKTCYMHIASLQWEELNISFQYLNKSGLLMTINIMFVEKCPKNMYLRHS